MKQCDFLWFESLIREDGTDAPVKIDRLILVIKTGMKRCWLDADSLRLDICSVYISRSVGLHDLDMVSTGQGEEDILQCLSNAHLHFAQEVLVHFHQS